MGGLNWEYRGPPGLESLVPHIGIGEIRAHVEVNRYAPLTWINDTLAMDQAVQEELTAIRDTVMQNRQG